MTGEQKATPQGAMVACDSNVLMWAFPWPERSPRKKTSQDVKEMRKRARILMKYLDHEGASIVIPSVVLSEFLAYVDPTKHGAVLAEFNERFICPPFDVPACPLAAKLWQFERGLKGVHGGLPESERTERRVLKSDILIVASARLAGATVFFSHEEKCRRLASEAGMEAKDLPTSTGDWILDYEASQEGDGS